MAGDIYTQMVEKIVREQATIIGALAWQEAQKVEGLIVGENTVVVTGADGKSVVDTLVGRYERLFGKASVAICAAAVQSMAASLPEEKRPHFSVS